MSKPSRYFVFCVHAHQPVGNFGNVFLEAYEKCYRPFFETLEKHPKFKLVSHFSGSLLDWLEAHRPEFIQKVRNLADAEQVEILGGAYYEPIYGLISKNDLAGQIDMMQRKIKTLFGQKPSGAWLTERVWDPDLVKPLEKAGVEYTVLDDTHFEKAKRRLPITGYYKAKGGSGVLDLFASQKALRYLVPFRPVGESLAYIRSLQVGPKDVIVLADDCEKFGFWPGTYDWVYGPKGWLDQWMTMMENEPALQLVTFSEVRKLSGPVDHVRVPHSSYSEMMQWCNGDFYNFFEKYPESRYMKERMHQISAKLERVSTKQGRGTQDKIHAALYRAQCNCSYWHGIFGGLYLHHLRSAVFENLIQAEGWLNGKKDHALIALESFESQRRWVFRQRNIVSYFNPNYGAAMEELDYLPLPANLTCTIQRRHEPYHALASKNGAPASGGLLSIHEILGSKVKDLKQAIYYDPFRRLSFLDHFFGEMIGLETFHRSSYKEIGDFTDSKYQAALGHGTLEDALVFERRGVIRQQTGRTALILKKTVRPVGDSCIEVCYRLKNLSRLPANFAFGVEFNFSIGAKEARKAIEAKNISQWTFEDAWRGLEIRLETDRASTLLGTPVETISESESGLEKTYQQLAVLVQTDWVLGSGESKEQTIRLNVGKRFGNKEVAG